MKSTIPVRDLAVILIFFFGLAFLQLKLYLRARKLFNLILVIIFTIIGLFVVILAAMANFAQGN